MPVKPGRKLSAHSRGVAAALTGMVAYATGPAMIRGALLGGMSTWALLSSRMVVASALLLGILGALRRSSPAMVRTLSLRDIRDGLLLGAFTYGLQLSLFTLSVERAGASITVILFNAFPVFVITITALTGRERLTARNVIAVSVSLVGVAVVALANGDIEADLVGMALALGSGFGYALMVIGSDFLGGRIPPIQLTTLLTIGAGLALVAITPITGYSPPSTTETILLTIAIAIVPSAIGTLGLVEGMRLIGPSLTSLLVMLEPPVAVVIAWIFLGESLLFAQILGGLLILAGIAIARRPEAPKADVAPG